LPADRNDLRLQDRFDPADGSFSQFHVANSSPSLNHAAVPGFIKNVLRLLAREKKWWIIPILITLAVVGLLLWLLRSPEPLSPFMYSR